MKKEEPIEQLGSGFNYYAIYGAPNGEVVAASSQLADELKQLCG